MKNDIGVIQQGIQSKIWSHGLIGNYEIVRKIGEGSFSSVFLAAHVMTRHEVVLKSAEKLQLNLASEIANMSLLNHPHIVRLYEYIVMPDRVWLVLEYCGGQELFNHLVMSKIIKPLHACRLFAQLTGAVAYAHQLHCAHRDLKLENVLLDDDGNIKLGDFGFTRSYVPRTMLETVCGTESYMAPELIQHQKYNPEAADAWSLGVILYAMIYGKLPFDEDNIADTVKMIVEVDPPFPPVEKGEYLVDIARKLLRKQPNARPRAFDILESLKEPGKHQKQLLARITKHPESSFIFSSREERNVLKGMKALTIDLRTVASSVVHHKCDPLHGLWYTALDRQRVLSKHSLADHSAVSALQRKKSKASMISSKSQNSQKKVRSAASTRNIFTGDATKDSGYGDTSLQSEADVEETRTTSLDAYQQHSIAFEPPSSQYNFSLNSTPQGTRSSPFPGPPESESISKELCVENRISETPHRVITAPAPLSQSQLSQTTKDFPELSAKLQADVQNKQQELGFSNQAGENLGAKARPSMQTRMNEFLERRSTGRSRRAMEKIMSAISFKKHISKDSLMNYYTPTIEDSKASSVDPPQDSVSRLPFVPPPLVSDSIPTGSSQFGSQLRYQSPNSNRKLSVYRRMESPVLDLGKSSPPSSRRHSTLSLASSNSFSIGELNRGLEPQSDLANGTGSETPSLTGSQTAQAVQSPIPASPIYGIGSSGLSATMSRQMSTYSQISQISQLSQSSVEPSQLLGDINESPKSTSSKFQTTNLVSTSRWNSSTSKWKAGASQTPASTTPPGTPIVVRSRAARLNTVKGMMPSKIEEGEDEAEW